jgi:hypothetical protein
VKKPIVVVAVTVVRVLAACSGASTSGDGLPSSGALTGGGGGPVMT